MVNHHFPVALIRIFLVECHAQGKGSGASMFVQSLRGDPFRVSLTIFFYESFLLNRSWK